ncbi:hypothetical protein PFISCL1PPCAC_21622 [Pristionchus fissidentatus]|uniref:G protein-coupled receptor n=1 Tax=Pristionchus fissidentatus TaxID=1538716 RepID=A0AAV5WID4_9BILA|nr:hypothetical protein PFISCL1PPCAC_21622 [Pristionchus fissidentatus]
MHLGAAVISLRSLWMNSYEYESVMLHALIVSLYLRAFFRIAAAVSITHGLSGAIYSGARCHSSTLMVLVPAAITVAVMVDWMGVCDLVEIGAQCEMIMMGLLLFFIIMQKLKVYVGSDPEEHED